MTETHKWACPHEWLDDYVSAFVETRNIAGLAYIFKQFAKGLDHDTIQGYFERDVTAWGYFDPVDIPVLDYDVFHGMTGGDLWKFLGGYDSLPTRFVFLANLISPGYHMHTRWEAWATEGRGKQAGYMYLHLQSEIAEYTIRVDQVIGRDLRQVRLV